MSGLELKAVRLSEKFSLIHDYWVPRIAAELNGQHVKLAKLHGEFVWHDHADGDELFFVLKGCLCMQYQDETGAVCSENVGEGEFVVVPRGVQHCPLAPEEVHVLLFEPVSMINTGAVEDSRTRRQLEIV